MAAVRHEDGFRAYCKNLRLAVDKRETVLIVVGVLLNTSLQLLVFSWFTYDFHSCLHVAAKDLWVWLQDYGFTRRTNISICRKDEVGKPPPTHCSAFFTFSLESEANASFTKDCLLAVFRFTCAAYSFFYN